MNENKTKNYKNKKNKILFSLLTVIFIILFLSVIFKCKNSPENSNSFQNGHHYYIEERQKTQNNALSENPGNEVSGKKSDDFNQNEDEQKSFLEQSEQRENENELSEIEKQKEFTQKDEFEKKDLKLKELNSDYVDSAGNRITNDDYDELELIAAKIQNRKSLKFIIDFINESMTAVDEPTKQMIINVLKKDMDEISDIVHEYQSYKKSNDV